MRCRREVPTGEKSMSPCPSSDSAPFWSRITRESVCEETAKAIRDGTLALIMPGDHVDARALRREHEVDAHRARLLGQPDDRVLDVGRRDHHQVGELVDHAQDVGAARARRRAWPGAVELGEVARARQRHHPVALLHLAHQVLQRVGRHPRAGDHRREQVRDRVVVVELDLLGVDEHQPDVVRRGAQQDRSASIALTQPDLPAPVVPATSRWGILARSAPIARPATSLPSQTRQRRPVRGRVLEDVAQVDDPPPRVGDLDAHGLLAGDRGEDADLGRRQRVGEVVLELGDLGDLGPGRQAQLVARPSGFSSGGTFSSGSGSSQLGSGQAQAEASGSPSQLSSVVTWLSEARCLCSGRAATATAVRILRGGEPAGAGPPCSTTKRRRPDL